MFKKIGAYPIRVPAKNWDFVNAVQTTVIEYKAEALFHCSMKYDPRLLNDTYHLSLEPSGFSFYKRKKDLLPYELNGDSLYEAENVVEMWEQANGEGQNKFAYMLTSFAGDIIKTVRPFFMRFLISMRACVRPSVRPSAIPSVGHTLNTSNHGIPAFFCYD